MRPVLRHAAHEQAEPRARDQQRHAGQHQRGEDDDRDAVARQRAGCSAPRRRRDIQTGSRRRTFCAPKIERTACISIRLMPQVASSVSSGRP